MAVIRRGSIILAIVIAHGDLIIEQPCHAEQIVFTQGRKLSIVLHITQEFAYVDLSVPTGRRGIDKGAEDFPDHWMNTGSCPVNDSIDLSIAADDLADEIIAVGGTAG